MCNTINGKQTLETWLLVLILFYASFSSSLALRLSSMSAAVLYKTKNKKKQQQKRPLSIEQRFLIQLNPSTTATLRTRESGSRCKEVTVVDRFKQESRGANHSTKIPTGPTGKTVPPQLVDQFF